jgi:replicative DNA helicase
MAKQIKEDFSYLGIEYQHKLILQMLTDQKFANTIIDIIDPNYFQETSLKRIITTIKEAKEEYDIIIDRQSLEYRVLEKLTDDYNKRAFISELRKIEECSLTDSIYVQQSALKFCKQQELKKSLAKISTIIDRGNIDDYDECEQILRKALEYGSVNDDSMNVLENMECVLLDDFRNPIPTGISGLDEIMDGGLSKGELGIILAPFGVGKTTMITKIANTAMNIGKNVLQIFFEDNPKVIQRKHLACWTGIELNNLSAHKEEIRNVVETLKTKKGQLKLKKFSSDGTTIPIIRTYVRKLIAQGFKPDVLLLDYIDCVEPSKKFTDVNAGEGSVMRQFETLLSEFEIAGWTAVQGNRSSIKSDVVESDQMGGSIKKGQIGHFIVSIAKSLDQKENGKATMAVLKSRFGKDGVVFTDITFDNARIQIDMGDSIGPRTHSEQKQDKKINEQARVRDVLEASQNRNNILTKQKLLDALVDDDKKEE